MSWSSAPLLALLALAACGFTPAYAPGGKAAALAGNVSVATPGNERAYDLARAMQTRLGPAPSPRFRLSVDISVDSEAVAITTAQDINRFNLVGDATYVLTDLNGTVTASGRARGFTSYSAAGTTVATLAAERDAYERLTVILADSVLSDMIARTSAAPDDVAAANGAPDDAAAANGAAA